MRFIIWEKNVQKKTDFWIVLCCILKEPKINMLEFSCWCKKNPNLSMKNYTQFHSFSLIKRVKYEMISPFSRNEKWKIFSLHSFREVKVKNKWLKIEIEKWKWKSNDSKSRSRSEFSKKFSRILENRDSRWSLPCFFEPPHLHNNDRWPLRRSWTRTRTPGVGDPWGGPCTGHWVGDRGWLGVGCQNRK